MNSNSIYLASLLFLATFLVSCSPVEQQIAHRWKMVKVFNDDEDVTAEHNPANDRWIELDKSGNYTSGGTPYGANSGHWTYEHDLLFLDSDADEGDDSYWTVSFEGSKMIWQGAKFEFTKTFRIIYEKSDPQS